MPADQLTVRFLDFFGGETTLTLNVVAGLGPTNADLLNVVQAWRNMSQAQVTKVSLIQTVALPAVNPVPADAGSYDKVRDQAIIQARREDGSGFVRMTVPAPLDTIFEPAGPFGQAQVDLTDALIVAFNNLALNTPGPIPAGEVWRSAQGDLINLDKGWRKGQEHA